MLLKVYIKILCALQHLSCTLHCSEFDFFYEELLSLVISSKGLHIMFLLSLGRVKMICARLTDF